MCPDLQYARELDATVSVDYAVIVSGAERNGVRERTNNILNLGQWRWRVERDRGGAGRSQECAGDDEQQEPGRPEERTRRLRTRGEEPTGCRHESM
jgi:hypothetical protein